GDAAPATAANTLQSHMSHLRRVLDDRAVIVARSSGYLLDVDCCGNTDVDVAACLIEESSLQPDPVLRETLLRDAVALWRGPIWGDAAPATAANTLQSHMSHLRRVLDDRAVIVARSSGYLLDVDCCGNTDVDVAACLIEESSLQPDPVLRETLLRDAVALWRG